MPQWEKRKQMMYYRQKQAELEKEIAELEQYFESANKNLPDDLRSQSMAVLKNKLAIKYGDPPP